MPGLVLNVRVVCANAYPKMRISTMADASSGDQDQARRSQSLGYRGYGQRQVPDHGNDAHAAFCSANRKYASSAEPPPNVNDVLDQLRETAAAHDEN
jgi:hypothetical protein